MRKVGTKPISVNQCWQGRRYKTPEYKAYEKEVLMQLRPLPIPDGPLAVTLKLWFTNAAADIDNPVKPILDILQKAYGFNDSRIYRLAVEKNVLRGGNGYFEFAIDALPQAEITSDFEARIKVEELRLAGKQEKAA